MDRYTIADSSRIIAVKNTLFFISLPFYRLKDIPQGP